MRDFSFNPFGTKSIILKFDCDKCGTQVVSEEMYVQSPNYSADTSSDSQVESEDYVVCGSCEKEFEVCIYVSYSGAHGVINDLPANCSVVVAEQSEPEDENELFWKVPSTEQLSIFENHLKSVDKLLGKQFDSQTEFSLLVMLHAHIVAATELFLSSVFIREVTNSEELTRKLIETDPEFGNRKFSLKDIYQQQEKLKTTVTIYLKELIFHDLKKIKPMYKSVLDFDFGDIGWLFQAVLKRHDCAHRAGYDKEGSKIEITVKDIKDLVSSCRSLAEKIDTHVINNHS